MAFLLGQSCLNRNSENLMGRTISIPRRGEVQMYPLSSSLLSRTLSEHHKIFQSESALSREASSFLLPAMSSVEGRSNGYHMGIHIQHRPRGLDDDHEKPRLVEQQRMSSRSYAREGSESGQRVAPYQNFDDGDDEALDMPRRCSTLGATLLTEYGMSSQQESNRFGSAAPGTSVLSLHSVIPRLQPGQVFMAGLSGEPTCEPPFRPMVGGGAAAAYNALRFDFYMQKQKAAKQKRRMSSLSMGSAKLNTGDRFYSSSNNNCSSLSGTTNKRRGGSSLEEQYEMLKLHHLNLMNEIQETALMLNLYEQQQLAREQQEEMRQMRQARHLANQQQKATTGQSSVQAATIPDEIESSSRSDKKRTSFDNCEVPNKRQK